MDALRLVSAAKMEWSRIGVDLHIKFWDDLLDRYLTKARAALDSSSADRAWEDGAAIMFDDAVTLALNALPPS